MGGERKCHLHNWESISATQIFGNHLFFLTLEICPLSGRGFVNLKERGWENIFGDFIEVA
jgi:hypothetical protein